MTDPPGDVEAPEGPRNEESATPSEHELPGDPPASVRALDRRAQRQRKLGRLLEAANLWTEALSMECDTPSVGADWRFVLCWETARVLSRLGQLGKASAFYNQALASTGVQRAEGAWTEGCLLSDLAELYRRRGEPLEARSLAERALAALGPGEESPAARILVLSRLGRLYAEARAWEDAEACYRQALNLIRSQRGEAHPDFGRSLANLAELYRSCRSLVQARDFGRQRWTWCRRHLGSAHPESISALVALADVLAALRRPVRALVLYRHAWRLAEAPSVDLSSRPFDTAPRPNKTGQGRIYPNESPSIWPSSRPGRWKETLTMSDLSSTPPTPSLGGEPPSEAEPLPDDPLTETRALPAEGEAAPQHEVPSLPEELVVPAAGLAPETVVERDGESTAPSESQQFASERPDLADGSEKSLRELLAELRSSLEEKALQLQNAFEVKLAFDSHKEQQIDVLHRELQDHKRGLLAQATRPLVAGLVRLHDDLGRSASSVNAGRAEELGPERVEAILREFQEDVEILLEENGITAFEEPAERFDPARQIARRTVEVREADLAGCIAARLRPGFEQDEKVLVKERVAVYVTSTQPEEGAAE